MCMISLELKNNTDIFIMSMYFIHHALFLVLMLKKSILYN